MNVARPSQHRSKMDFVMTIARRSPQEALRPQMAPTAGSVKTDGAVFLWMDLLFPNAMHGGLSPSWTCETFHTTFRVDSILHVDFFFLICHLPFNTFPVNTPLPLLIHASHPSQSWHNTNTLSCDLSHPVCHAIHSSLSLLFTRSLCFSLPVSLSFASVFRTLLQLVCPYKAVVNQWGFTTRTQTCVHTHTLSCKHGIMRTNTHPTECEHSLGYFNRSTC